jgi:glycosyltransferase involved in cell wall biosynthesis
MVGCAALHPPYQALKVAMQITHLTASTFFGGPERQMLGLAQHLDSPWGTSFVSFAEQERCQAFLAEVRRHGFNGTMLNNDTPHLRLAATELATVLRRHRTDVLCCHGYKANLLGRLAARRLSIPALAVSRGWTDESLRVRLYEVLDRLHLRCMDHVVCVSHGQAAKVRRAGVAGDRLSVIHNAIRTERFAAPRPDRRQALQELFVEPPALLVGAAGRLSPEKGFDILIEAAGRLAGQHATVGFVLFGEGVLRPNLTAQIHAAGLASRFLLAGYRSDLDELLPCLDVLVLPSHTEGLPNVVLEACAARVPVVATAVGGTPEVIDHGVNGLLVPAGDSMPLATALHDLLGSARRRRNLGEQGWHKVSRQFTFAAQAEKYVQLFDSLLRPTVVRRRARELQPC